MNAHQKIVELHEDRSIIINYVQRLGNASSLALLNPACTFFSIPHIDGVIGYRIESQCAVVFGDPLCHPQDIPTLIQEFQNYCESQKYSVIYIVVSEEFTNWILCNSTSCAIGFGDEIIINPLHDQRTQTGQYAHLLRQKYKNAILNGVTVHEYTHHDSALEKTIEDIARGWLHNRRGPQVYLLPIDIFSHRANKRWFYATHNNEVVGILVINRIDAYQGWVLNGSVMLTPQAPKSTSEFLVLSVLEILRNEGCQFFSVGPTPSLELGRIEKLGKITQLMLRMGFKIAQKFFKLSERQRYWKKFKPQKKPTFLVFNGSGIGFSDLYALMGAFNVRI